MHKTQQKLLKLSKENDISEMSYRKIAELIKVKFAQQIKHHLEQLQKEGEA